VKIKKNKITYIVIVLILLGVQSIYYRYVWSNKVSAYKVQRTTEDLELTFEGLTFVAMNNGVYVQPGWILRTSPNNHSKVENIMFIADIDNKEVIRMGLSDFGDKLFDVDDSPTFIKNVNVNDDSTLNIKFTYYVDKEKREFQEDLKLKWFKTQIMKW
jgi:hypothetical protein